jgi:hypothetical protein
MKNERFVCAFSVVACQAKRTPICGCPFTLTLLNQEWKVSVSRCNKSIC